MVASRFGGARSDRPATPQTESCIDTGAESTVSLSCKRELWALLPLRSLQGLNFRLPIVLCPQGVLQSRPPGAYKRNHKSTKTPMPTTVLETCLPLCSPRRGLPGATCNSAPCFLKRTPQIEGALSTLDPVPASTTRWPPTTIAHTHTHIHLAGKKRRGGGGRKSARRSPHGESLPPAARNLAELDLRDTTTACEGDTATINPGSLSLARSHALVGRKAWPRLNSSL